MAVFHASAHPDVVETNPPALSAHETERIPTLLASETEPSSHAVVMAWYRFYASVLKRMIDVTFAATALLFLALVMIVVAIAIRLDSPGPVLYRQNRVGKGGRIFTIFKFRTMLHQPETSVQFFTSTDGKVSHKVRNDPRMTRLGVHLRRLSIDELPQLLNILRGDMSLIGPRPELVEIVGRYESWQHRRHLVRPGLTGWWQVNGRSDRPMHENTELDIYYVHHISPGLDLKILVRTAVVVTTGLGAF